MSDVHRRREKELRLAKGTACQPQKGEELDPKAVGSNLQKPSVGQLSFLGALKGLCLCGSPAEPAVKVSSSPSHEL